MPFFDLCCFVLLQYHPPKMQSLIFLILACICVAVTLEKFDAKDVSVNSVSQAGKRSSSLQVDLGYEIYEGVFNASTGLDTWLGWVPDLVSFFSSTSS